MIRNDIRILLNEIFDDIQSLPVAAITQVGEKSAVALQIILILVGPLFKIGDSLFGGFKSLHNHPNPGNSVADRVVRSYLWELSCPISRLSDTRTRHRVCHQKLRGPFVRSAGVLARHDIEERGHAVRIKAGICQGGDADPVGLVLVRASEVDLLLCGGSLGNHHSGLHDIATATSGTGDDCTEHDSGGQQALP